MNRRDFIRNIGWSVLTAAGMIIAAASREPVHAGGKKGGRKSSSGKGKSNSSSTASGGSSKVKTKGNAGTSNVSTMDLGSGR